ncbi:hypothetical protein TUBRATIS_005280 [Tubulinosema ratisbonensis]|uniref:Uncharacterized protein n=1 Tax=Tubulinosema ratisbonensis TaxID=291195 RepID=A0A437AP05_9MICR|nr:hypothetical protein TUBRATIS_005280 [Tubulinosema ratisbonensis]
MNINKNEMLKLSEKNFKKEKRNYIKSIPRYIKKEEKINTNENVDHNLNINYDIDGIIGIFSPNQIRKFINEQISINFTKIKPKTDTFYFIRNSLEYSIKEIEFINFGAIHLGSSYKIDVFLANLDYKIDLSVLNKIFSLYNLKIKSDCYNKLSFDKKKTVFNGLIALKNFFNLEECIKRVLDNSGIIFIEILGCKKNFNDYNVENLIEMVEKYINIKNDNFVLDFCISVLSHNSKIIYPKNDFLKNIGETPNYFQFFSYECPNVNRNKPKYKSSNKYLEDLNVIKVNFYSSTQDLFNKLSAQKYYPLLSKCLLKDIIADNTSYSSYFKQLDKYKEIQLKARAAQKPNAERIYYRFEFRLQAININELELRISKKLKPNNFTYFDKTKFLNLVENNVIFFLDFINSIEKKVLSTGKVVILESLFVNSYLRGNIFLLPFTTRLLRTEIKTFWKQTPYMLNKSNLDNVFSSSEHYDTLANFLKTINGINTKNKENITCFLKYRPLFNKKEIFLNEIKNLILTDQPKYDKNKKALFLENPVTFYKNNFLPSLKKSSILFNLI